MVPIPRKRKFSGTAQRRSLKRQALTRSLLYPRREAHYIDETCLNGAVAAGGVVLNLNSVGCGSSYTNRSGFVIQSRYIFLEWLVLPPSNGLVYDTVAFALVYDKNCNAAAPAYGAVFDATTATVTLPGLERKYVAVNGDRFAIVRRWHSELGKTGDGSYGTRGTVYFKIPPRLSAVRYSGTAAAVPNSGGWFLCARTYLDTGNTATSMCCPCDVSLFIQ